MADASDWYQPRCENCTVANPNVVLLVPVEDTVVRVNACGRSCVEALQAKYVRYYLKASVRALEGEAS